MFNSFYNFLAKIGENSSAELPMSRVEPIDLPCILLASHDLLRGNEEKLDVIGPMPFDYVNKALKDNPNLFATTHKPTMFIIHVSGHWISCFVLPKGHSAQFYLVDSLTPEQGFEKQTQYREIYQLFNTAHKEHHKGNANVQELEGNLIYTSHQLDEQICGICCLLFLQRFLEASTGGISINSTDDMKRSLIRESDGLTPLERQLFIVEACPINFNLDKTGKYQLG